MGHCLYRSFVADLILATTLANTSWWLATHTRLDADQMLPRVAPASSLVPGGLGILLQQPGRLIPRRRPARRAWFVHTELQRIHQHRLEIATAFGQTLAQVRAVSDHPLRVRRGRTPPARPPP